MFQTTNQKGKAFENPEKLPEYNGENPMNNGQKIRGIISRLSGTSRAFFWGFDVPISRCLIFPQPTYLPTDPL